jgi:plasmid stabilization system protein ParE
MIIFSPGALGDIARLRTFLNHVDPGAAQRAIARIMTTIEQLQAFPDRGSRTMPTYVRS